MTEPYVSVHGVKQAEFEQEDEKTGRSFMILPFQTSRLPVNFLGKARILIGTKQSALPVNGYGPYAKHRYWTCQPCDTGLAQTGLVEQR
jgi:hypothetical protein